MSDLIARAYETLDGWRAFGHEQLRSPRALLVRSRSTPNVYDANFAAQVRAESPAEIDAFLDELERTFGGFEHRQVFSDPGLPAPCEARLILEGFQSHNEEIVLVLEGALASRGRVAEIRPVETEDDWQALEVLHWEDHREEVVKGFHEGWQRRVTTEIVAAKRSKAPGVRYFLARSEGVDCAFFSAWPGENGVGKVEDLFTLNAFRGRGIATALIAHCVDDARARGAGPLLICARTGDTPMHMYAKLGFRPLCVQRTLLRRLGG